MTTGADNSAGMGYPQGTERLFGPDDNDIIQRQPAHEINRRTPNNEGFVRSVQVERIVVFYKDKTFSEYQPE